MGKKVSLLDTECCFMVVKSSKPILITPFAAGGPYYKIYVSFQNVNKCSLALYIWSDGGNKNNFKECVPHFVS